MTYKEFWGGGCLLCFFVGLWTKSPYAYWGALITGALSRASVIKKWESPPWMQSLTLAYLKKKLGLLDKDEDGL